MPDIDVAKRLVSLLSRVKKPARYVGGEWNQADLKPGALRVALAYPDLYEIGMSNLGLQILYEIVNGHPDFSAERVYAPALDLEELMRAEGLPLFSLETKTPVRRFDVFGLTLQYEMTFTNVLNLLDLAGIPLRSAGRGEDVPLVLAGGPCAFNPEPLSAFIDAFVVGESETAIVEVLTVVRDGRGEGLKRSALLERLAGVEGVYVPSLYRESPGGYPLQPTGGALSRVGKRLITGFDGVPHTARPPVPFAEAVQERCTLEIMRGCTRGCRFCQAGVIYRPVRERTSARLTAAAADLLDNTGYPEISLVSLSSTDHTGIAPLLDRLSEAYDERRVALSLPSLRLDRFSVATADRVSRVKKTGLTFAPEAGSDRLRAVINKGVGEDDLLSAAETALKAGWRQLKLYFMIGLPTETADDVRGVADLAHRVLDQARRVLSPKDFRRFKLIVSVSSFVPKAHTPFQWCAMDTMEELEAKQAILRGALRSRRIELRWHNAKLSRIEGIVARGGRRLADVLEEAWRLGCKFDGWSDHFDYDKWEMALARHGYDAGAVGCRPLAADEPLPWDHIDCHVDKDWLWREHLRALAAELTPDCRWGRCTICGACRPKGPQLELENRPRRGAGKDGADRQVSSVL